MNQEGRLLPTPYPQDNLAKEKIHPENTKTVALKQIKEWVEANPRIKGCRTDSKFLLRFLRKENFRVVDAQILLEKFLLTRQTHPEWFMYLDALNPRIESLIDRGYFFALPKRDESGRRVFFSLAGCVDPLKDTSSDMARVVQIGFESLMENEENQSKGFCYVLDLKDVGLSIISLWNLSDVTEALNCTEKKIPISHKEVHLINLPLGIHAVIEFGKTLLSAKIRKRLQVHSSMDKFYRMVPAEILPLEYGGKIPMEEMISSYKQELMAVRQDVLSLDNIRFEKPVPNKKKVHRSLQRSFALLEID